MKYTIYATILILILVVDMWNSYKNIHNFYNDVFNCESVMSITDFALKIGKFTFNFKHFSPVTEM